MLSVLVVPGIAEAVNSSPAQRVAVLNLITQDGETLGMKALDHLDVLSRLGGIVGGAVVVHRTDRSLSRPGHDQLFLDRHEAAALGWEMTEARVHDPEAEWPQHDPIRLGEVLAALAAERREPLSDVPALDDVDIPGRVLVRADLNVPLDDGRWSTTSGSSPACPPSSGSGRRGRW